MFLFSCNNDSSNSCKASLGNKVYSNNCVSCHGSEMAPNLTSHKLKISEIVLKVKYGGDGMYSFKNTLSEKEIENVAFYI